MYGCTAIPSFTYASKDALKDCHNPYIIAGESSSNPVKVIVSLASPTLESTDTLSDLVPVDG